MDASLILISILTLCLYNILIKKFPAKLILLFLVNLFSYLGFLAIYCFEVLVLNHDQRFIYELIYNYTYQDIPLYIIISLAFLGYMIVTEKLLNGYDLSLVIPISQFGILLTSAGFIALGDPFRWSLIFGFIVLISGTIITSIPSVDGSSNQTIFVRLKKIPKTLWVLTVAQALIFTVSSVITYTGTKENVRTDLVMDYLRRLHIGPIAFHSAFYFNLGQQFFSVIISAIYILSRKKYRGEILVPIIKNPKYLTIVVLSYLIAEYLYFIAFMITKDTTILLALDNLSIPIILLLSFFILQEDLNRNKIIGSSLIVLGGVIAVF